MAKKMLRNKEDVEKFLKTYKSWPVWVDVPQLGMVVYRYTFKSGHAIVATIVGGYPAPQFQFLEPGGVYRPDRILYPLQIGFRMSLLWPVEVDMPD